MEENSTPNRAAGGFARAEKLTPKTRKEIASKAAAARWNKDLPKASYEGTLQFGSIQFKCAVIEKPDGTADRVVSQTEFMSGLGMYYSGYIAKQHREQETSAELPIFLAQSALKPFIESNIDILQFKPFSYVTQSGSVAKGIPATIISRICKVWIDADKAGALKARQKAIAANAALIRDALADTAIIALVDEATGYQDVRARGELQTILDAFLKKSFAAWSKRIPDDFYKEIYRLRGWPWPGMQKNRYQVVGKYTTDLVYKRLAPGIQEQLEKINPKDDNGNRKAKNHQWLTDDLGHPALSHHMHAILAFMRASQNWDQFKALVDIGLPVKDSQVQFELALTTPQKPDEAKA